MWNGEQNLKTSDFEYELPPELIAQEPAAERDKCRLLVMDPISNTNCHPNSSRKSQLLNAINADCS